MQMTKYLKLKNNSDPWLVPHSSCLIDEVFVEKYCKNDEKKQLELEKKIKEQKGKVAEEKKKKEELKKENTKKVNHNEDSKNADLNKPSVYDHSNFQILIL
jgi:hypothetical protein